MCFSESVSLGIGLTGLAAAAYLYSASPYGAIGIGYFALMEIIQFFQYRVIDECDSDYNKFLTHLGYLHICFQPLFFNIWLFAFIKRPNFIVITMCFYGGLLLASRLFFVKDDELCDPKHEALCGKTTCAVSGERHIAWNIRLRAAGKYYFTPSIALHCFLWIVPTLSIFQMKPALAALISGPYIAYFLTNNIHEQPAIWCYTVIAQMLLSLALLG